jgi:hypothetical protein
MSVNFREGCIQDIRTTLRGMNIVTSTYQVFGEIKAYILNKGENYRNWYVGITDDARSRLFVDHGVSEKNDAWIFRKCDNNQAAKRIKETLVKMGCEGAAGGWDEDTTSVYAYLKSPNTTP